MSELADWLDEKAAKWRKDVGDDLLGGYAKLMDARRAGVPHVMIPHCQERAL